MRLFPTKRFWKRLAIGTAILIALALIANGFMAWLTDHRLQTRIAAIRAAGDPASISDLAPQPIPDDQNAAYILQRITPRIDEFANEYGRFFNTAVGKAYEEVIGRDKPPNAEQIAAIRAILEKYPDVDDALAAAAACDRYASQLDFSLAQDQYLDALLRLQGPIRQAVRFLGWKIEVDVADGRSEQALHRGIQTLRLARLYSHEPSMVSFLVAIAIRSIAIEYLYDALSEGPVSDESRAQLEQELVRHDTPQRLANALKSERAITGAWFNNVVGRSYPLTAHLLGWPMKSYQIGVFDVLDEQLPLATQPWHEVRARFGKADSIPPPSGHGALADSLLPAVRASFHANYRNLARLRSLRIYAALTQYRGQNGREATGLAELKMPTEATIDPYSGEPLKLKHVDDGWIIYSVMDNGVDDGGDFIDLKDWGVAPPRYRATEKHE